MHLSKEEKAMWLEDWKQSGKTAWSYAKENGLTPQTFAKWAKDDEKENKNDFVEIPPQAITPLKNSQGILVEKGDVKIHIPVTVCIKDLQTVFKALGAAQ